VAAQVTLIIVAAAQILAVVAISLFFKKVICIIKKPPLERAAWVNKQLWVYLAVISREGFTV